MDSVRLPSGKFFLFSLGCFLAGCAMGCFFYPLDYHRPLPEWIIAYILGIAFVYVSYKIDVTLFYNKSQAEKEEDRQYEDTIATIGHLPPPEQHLSLLLIALWFLGQCVFYFIVIWAGKEVSSGLLNLMFSLSRF